MYTNPKPPDAQRAGGRGGELRARAGGRGGEFRARAGGRGGELRARAGGRGRELRAECCVCFLRPAAEPGGP